jgi:hypothetical protein
MVRQNGGQIFFVLGFMSAFHVPSGNLQMHRPLEQNTVGPSEVKASSRSAATAATKVLNEPLLTAVSIMFIIYLFLLKVAFCCLNLIAGVKFIIQSKNKVVIQLL